MKKQGANIYDLVVFGATCFVYLFAFVFAYSAYTKRNVLHMKLANLPFVSTLYTTRWDFYTKTTDEPVCRFYDVQGGKAILRDVRPFTAKFFYGLKRDGKVIASETEGIAHDTLFTMAASKYEILMPPNGDINNYLRADTLKYNDYRSKNVRYLSGKALVTISPTTTWQQRRAVQGQPEHITVIPVNLVTIR